MRILVHIPAAETFQRCFLTRRIGRMRAFCFALVLVSLAAARGCLGQCGVSRDDFPKDFVFGAGTSAYQVEGAAAEDGRTPSIWDTFCHSKNFGRGNGDVAADGYHKYKEDVKLMAETGLEAYRFSISWSRLLPNGRGPVNPLGLRYYNNLIDELISHGIQPHVTLFHYDLPQVLEDEYGGWLSARIVDDFKNFANICFTEFGDRVSHWTTINEPNVFALGGYDEGIVPPRRCSYPVAGNCSAGNSALEPYIVTHHCLLAHAAAVSLYRANFQAKQRGSIGLNVFVYYFLPSTNSSADRDATQRAFDFYNGWLVEPLVRGDYPASMRKIVGFKLPSFTTEQRQQILNSWDFFGINFYATLRVKHDPNSFPVRERDFGLDLSAKLSGEPFSSATKYNSFGLKGTLEYFKQFYGNPPIYVHENGFAMPHDTKMDDEPRVMFLAAYVESVLDALRNGSNVKGYIIWSFVDVFELLAPYTQSYGLYYVDFDDKNLTRQPKLSARWYSDFIKGKNTTMKKGIALHSST